LESSAQGSPENPARGQCNVTALVVCDRVGGEILKTPVGDDWHFYNRVAGTVYDLTAEQFAVPPAYPLGTKPLRALLPIATKPLRLMSARPLRPPSMLALADQAIE